MYFSVCPQSPIALTISFGQLPLILNHLANVSIALHHITIHNEMWSGWCVVRYWKCAINADISASSTVWICACWLRFLCWSRSFVHKQFVTGRLFMVLLFFVIHVVWCSHFLIIVERCKQTNIGILVEIHSANVARKQKQWCIVSFRGENISVHSSTYSMLIRESV